MRMDKTSLCSFSFSLNSFWMMNRLLKEANRRCKHCILHRSRSEKYFMLNACSILNTQYTCKMDSAYVQCALVHWWLVTDSEKQAYDSHKNNFCTLVFLWEENSCLYRTCVSTDFRLLFSSSVLWICESVSNWVRLDIWRPIFIDSNLTCSSIQNSSGIVDCRLMKEFTFTHKPGHKYIHVHNNVVVFPFRICSRSRIYHWVIYLNERYTIGRSYWLLVTGTHVLLHYITNHTSST